MAEKEDERNKRLDDAYDELSELFREGGFWTPFYSERYILHRWQAAQMATATTEILRLLQEYPELAGEGFYDNHRYEDDQPDRYPLEIFIWNCFGIKILDRVRSLYPNAATDGQTLDYLNHLGEVESEETLLWVLKNCREDPSSEAAEFSNHFPPLQKLLMRLRAKGYRGAMLSPRVVRAFIEEREKDKIPLCDLMQAEYCEERIEFAMETKVKREGSSITFDSCFDSTLHVNQMHARLLVRALPKLEELTLKRVKYSVDSLVDILNFLQTCLNLKKVYLELKPLCWLTDEPAAMEALRSYLQQKPSTMHLTIDLDGEDTHSGDESEKNGIDPSNSSALFFSKLLKGMDQEQPKIALINQLDLRNFHNLPGKQLQLLVDLVDHISLRRISVARSTSGFCPAVDNGIDRFSCNLWSRLCEVSERVQLRHFSFNHPKPIEVDISLDNSLPDGMDITTLVEQALACRPLFMFRIDNDSFFFGEPRRRCLDIGVLCKALARNCTLNWLTLKNLDFENNGEQTIPSMLAQVLEGQNTSLTHLNIEAGHNLYTIPFGEKESPFKHIDYDSAIRVEYLLKLNGHGRAKLRRRTATAADVVNALDGIRQCVPLYSRELLPVVDGMVPALTADNDLEQLNSSFEHLLDRVGEWSKAPLHKHACDMQSILYGTLRESPELWCTVHVNKK